MDDGNMKLTTKLLRSICEALLMYDLGVVEIIQFGSSVYMPEYAKDMDLIVFTKKAKEYDGYVTAFMNWMSLSILMWTFRK